MLCPNCLKNVERFTQVEGAFACPQCREAVPLLYVKDYAEYPPVVFSLVGLPGHGKTVYLSSLLYEFERMGSQWPGFTYTPLDEGGLRTVREKQQALEQGDLPESTRKVFPKPVVLQLDGMPQAGRCHLLLSDTAGEVFQQVSDMKQYAGYVSRSPVVLWLVSLSDLDSPAGLSDFLTVYVQAVLELGGEVSDQTLLVVLTKGDELMSWEGTPESVRDYVSGNHQMDSPREWEQLSDTIEGWLEEQPGYVNFVRLARKRFKRVLLTIVSALGSKPEGKRHLAAVSPRGVLMPLYFVIALEKEKWEVQRQKVQEEQDRRAEGEAKRKEAEQRLLVKQRGLADARKGKRRRVGRIAALGFVMGPLAWAMVAAAWGFATGPKAAGLVPLAGWVASLVLGLAWGGITTEWMREAGFLARLRKSRAHVLAGAVLGGALFVLALATAFHLGVSLGHPV